MLKKFTLLLMAITLLLGFANLKAQFGPYDFSSETGTYVPLSNSATTLELTQSGDIGYSTVTLPFSFTYNGVAYENITVATNGYVLMGNNFVEITGNFLDGRTSNVLAPFASNLYINETGAIKAELTGTAPNRVFSIQWENFRHGGNREEPYQNLNFQLKLNETTNNIEYVYGSFGDIDSKFSAGVQVGLRGTTENDFATREIMGNWTFTIDGGTAATMCYFDNKILPQSGLKFSFKTPFANVYRRNLVSQTSGFIVTGSPVLNKQMMRIIVRTEGSNLPNATVSSFTFSTIGTTNPLLDLYNAKLFYTGTSPSFATSSQFGTTVNSPNGNFVFITSPIQLSEGNNYFWLTYDINTAQSNLLHEIKAHCNSMVVGGASVAATPTEQPGGLVIREMLRGIYNVGNIPGTDYKDLSTAFRDLNDLGLSANVFFRVVSNINDTITTLALPMTERGTGNYTIHVFPEGGNWTIYSEKAENGLFNLYGAKNITFDGQFYPGGIPGTVPGDEQSHLTLQYATPSNNLSPIFLLGDAQNSSGEILPARNITVKYCSMYSSNPQSWNNMGVYINGSNATISNIKILNNRIWGCYNGIYSSGSDIHSIENLDIKNNIIGNDDPAISFNNYGISISYAKNGIIDNNLIYNSIPDSYDNYGIYLNSCSQVAGSRFEITNNTVKQLLGQSYKYGIFVTSTNNPQISKNVISDFSSSANKGTCYGIYVDQSTFDDLGLNSAIEKNRINNLSADYTAIGCLINSCMKARILGNEIFSLNSLNGSQVQGIVASGMNQDTSNIIIANNVIYDLNAYEGTWTAESNPWGIILNGGSEFYIYHNSVNVDSAFTSTEGGGEAGALLISNNNIHKVNVKNNILSAAKTGRGSISSYCVYTRYDSWPTGDIANSFDNNIYWKLTSGNNYIGYSNVDPWQYRTLDLWRVFTGADGASQNIDPMYGSRTYLIPVLGSPAFNAGTPTFVNTDIYGNLRSATAPTVGAYEKPAQALTSPVNGAIEVAYTPTAFSWVSTAGATNYNIQISTDRFFATTLIDQTVTSNTFSAPLSRVKIYYWRVRAFDASGDIVTYWSPTSMFITSGPMDTPVLTYPADLDVINLSNIELKWNKVLSAVTYTLQLSTAQDFSNILYQKDNIAKNVFLLPEILLPNQSTYWRVRAVKPANTSDWSLSRMFTVSTKYEIVESFDKSGKIPYGWDAEMLSGTSYWTIVSECNQPYTEPHSPTNAAEFAGIDANGNSCDGEGVLISPCIDYRNRGENDAPVSFWMYRDGGNSGKPDERVEVYANTAANMSGSPVLLGTISRYMYSEPSVGPDEWEGWYQYTFNVPSEFNGSSNFIIFKGINQGGENIFVDDVKITAFPLMNVYISSITTQPPSTDYPAYGKKKHILGIQVTTEGMLNLKSATSFRFNTTGSTLPTDIKNAKLFYTGTSSKFETVDQYGETVNNPSGAFTINGNQVIGAGKHYFWLTYDISSQATIGDFLDAQFLDFTLGGQTLVPTNPGTESRYTVKPIMMFDLLQQVTVSEEKPYNNYDKNGVETDGTYIYVTSAQTMGEVSKYDMDGNFISKFTIAMPYSDNWSGLSDLAYDGRYFWGGTNYWGDNHIWKFDFQANPPAIVDSIELNPDVYNYAMCVAYQPAAEGRVEGFWIYNSNYDAGGLDLINMEGAVISSIPNTLWLDLNIGDIAGLAIDTYTSGGPYLWLNVYGPVLYQVGNIYAGGEMTGIKRNYIYDLFTPDQIDYQPSAGGLYIYKDETADVVILGGITRATNNLPSTLFNFFLLSTGNMTYGTTYAEQNETGYVQPGSSNQRMLDIKVVTNGIDSPLDITSMTFNITGTTNPSDIVNAKLFYTGLNPNFSTARQVGTFVAPTGSFTIDVTGLSLIGGINYFWMTYDVRPTAANFNVLDAEMNSLVVGGIARTPVPSGAIVGSRIITRPLSGDYTVGVGGDFPNLNGAFNAVSAVGLVGNTNFLIISDIVEPKTAELIGWDNTAGYILKIFPSSEPRRIECNDSTVVKLLGADYVVFDGSIGGVGNDRSLTIANTSIRTGAAGFRLLRSYNVFGGCVHDVTIKNTIIQSSIMNRYSYGIYAGQINDYNIDVTEESHNIIIDNNLIFNTFYGIYYNQNGWEGECTHDVYIRNNKIGNEDPSKSIGNIGIFISQVRPFSDETPEGPLAYITENEIYNIVKRNDEWESATGIYIQGCTNIDIKSNIMYNITNFSSNGQGPCGISSNYSSKLNIHNNAVFGISGIGSNSTNLMPRGISIISDAIDISLLFNSFVLNGSFLGNDFGPYYSSALYFEYWNTEYTNNITVKNNLFANTMTSTEQETRSSAMYNPNSAIFAGSSPDYNDYYAPYVACLDSWNYITDLASLKAATLADESSISEDPMLTSATNLMPLIESPLVFAGFQMFDVMTDISGVVRQDSPTIGAYEYSNFDLLAPPITLLPVNKSYGVATTPCTFKWKSVGQASSYDMQLTTDPLFADENIVSFEDLGDTTVVAPLEELTRYYFRVRSKNEVFTSIWTKKMTFFTKGELTVPILISPENQVSFVSVPTFSWTECKGTSKYRIEIAQNPNFISSVIVDSTSSLFYNNNNTVLDRGNYYWRVRAGNGVNNSAWSEIRIFSYFPCEGIQQFNTAITDCNWVTNNGGNSNWNWAQEASWPVWVVPYSRPGMAAFESWGSAGDFANLYSNKFDFSLRNGRPATVSFEMFRYSQSTADNFPDAIEVYANTSQGDDGAVLLGTISRLLYLEPVEDAPNHWSNYTMDIPANFNGPENYIFFKGIYQGGYTMFIDDVSISTFYPDINLPIPVLVSPENHQSGVSVRPRLRWNLLSFDGDVKDYSYNVQIVNENTYGIVLDTVVNNVAYVDPILWSGFSYSWKVRAVNNESVGVWSGRCEFTTISYCESNSLMCTDYTQYISSVSFGDMQNLNTACSVTSQGYSDYSAMYSTDTVGVSRSINVTVANGLSGDSFGAWFDWNQNGSFNDAGEFFQLTSNDDGTTYTGTITVPENATIGFSRMRLRVISNEDVLVPCGSSFAGEVEDYSIKIMPIMPILNITSINPTVICAGQEVEVDFDVSVVPFVEDNTFFVHANGPVSELIGKFSASATGSYNFVGRSSDMMPQGVYSITVEGYHYDIPVVSNPIDLTINALPIVYDIMGGGDYCIGGDGSEISLSGSETGVEYQLYRLYNDESTPIGSPVVGTGEMLSLGIQPLEGEYYVISRKIESPCEMFMNGITRIKIQPVPLTFNVIGGGVFCEGGNGVQIGLSGSQPQIEYQLTLDQEVIDRKTGNGRPFFFNNFYTTNGRYTIVGVNNNTGCSVLMNSFADVAAYPAPQIFVVSGGGMVCEQGNGVSINLSGSEENITYKLYGDGQYVSGSDIAGTGNPIEFTQINVPGAYSISAENGGCSMYMEGSAFIEAIATPQSFILSSPTNGHYCAGSATGAQLVLSGSQVGVNYEILLNGQFLTAVEGTDLPLTINNITLEGDYTVLAVNATTTCTRMMDGTVNVIIDALTVPTDGMPVGLNVDVNPAQFSWSLVDCASSYKLTVSTSQDFSDWVVNETIPAENLVLPFAVSGLANNTTYFWKVASENGELIVSSQAWSFTSSTGYPTQTIELPHGWSVISANVAPLNNSMPSIWQNIVDRLLIIKEGTGNFWMPPSTGSLSTWNSLNGYQVYITQPTTLSITGPQVPASTPIVMSSPGWYMVSYLPESPMQANQALSSIARQLVIAKNGLGEMYWPMFGVNNLSNSEGTMKPSFGYLIYVVNSAELVYPSNLSRISMINQFEGEPKVEFMKPTVERTGNSASMVLSIDNVSDGAEIALFNGNNEICGSGVVREGRAAITIWGDNSVTETREGAVENEMLTVKLYDKVSGKLSAIKLESVDELTRNSKGKTVNFVKDGLFVARGTANETNNELSVSCSPNPFNESTTISYEVVENAQVEVELFSLEGVKVASIASGWRNAGSYTAEYRNSDLSSGTYQLVLRSGTHTVSTMIVHVK